MEIKDNDFRHEVLGELKSINHKLESAFPRDDDGEPDYASHKIFHKKQVEDEKQYKESRAKVIRDIASWITIGILTMVGSSLFHTYFLSVIKKIP